MASSGDGRGSTLSDRLATTRMTTATIPWHRPSWESHGLSWLTGRVSRTMMVLLMLVGLDLATFLAVASSRGRLSSEGLLWP